jgi:hypothetical protein
MKYSAEMDSGVMIYIPTFIKISSGIQKLIARDRQTHRQHRERIKLADKNILNDLLEMYH